MSINVDLERPIFIIDNSTKLFYQQDNFLCYLKFIEPHVFNDLSFPGAYLIFYIYTNSNHEITNFELEYKWSYDNVKLWDAPLTLNIKELKDDINFLIATKENELHKANNIVDNCLFYKMPHITQLLPILFNIDIHNYLDFVGNDIFPTFEDWKELSVKNKYFYLFFTELKNGLKISHHLFNTKDIIFDNLTSYDYLELNRSPNMIKLEDYINNETQNIIWLNVFWIEPGDKILHNKKIYTVDKFDDSYIYLKEEESPLPISNCKNTAVIPEKDVEFMQSLLQMESDIIEALYNNEYYVLIHMDNLSPIVDMKNLKLNAYYISQNIKYGSQIRSLYFDKDQLSNIQPFQLTDVDGNSINLSTSIKYYVKSELNEEIKILETLKFDDRNPSFKDMPLKDLMEYKNSKLIHVDTLMFDPNYLAVQNENNLACIFHREIDNKNYYIFCQQAYKNIEAILRRMIQNKCIKLFYPKTPNFYIYINDNPGQENDVIREFTTGKYYYCTLHSIYDPENSPFGKIVTIEDFNWVDEGDDNIFIEVKLKDIESGKEYTDVIAYKRRYSNGFVFCYYLHEVKEIYEDDIYVKITQPDIFGLKSNGTEILKCKIEWTDNHELFVFKSGRVILDIDADDGMKIYKPRKSWDDRKNIDYDLLEYNYRSYLVKNKTIPAYTRNPEARSYSIIFASEAIKKPAKFRFQNITPLILHHTTYSKDFYATDILKHRLPIKEDERF